MDVEGIDPVAVYAALMSTLVRTVLVKRTSGSSTRLPTMVVWLPAAICLLLKVVAVAGRRVPHQLLAAVASLDDRQLDGALRATVTSQLLVARPGQDGYDLVTPCSVRRSTLTCCPANGPACPPPSPTPSPTCSVRVSWTGRTPPPRWPRIGAGRMICQRRWSGRCERPSPARHWRRGRRGDLRAWPPVRDGRRLTHPICPSCFRSFPQRVGDRTDASRPRPRRP
jgi:hypothetical protein